MQTCHTGARAGLIWQVPASDPQAVIQAAAGADIDDEPEMRHCEMIQWG